MPTGIRLQPFEKHGQTSRYLSRLSEINGTQNLKIIFFFFLIFKTSFLTVIKLCASQWAVYYIMGMKYVGGNLSRLNYSQVIWKMAFVGFLIFLKNIVDSKSFLICKLYFFVNFLSSKNYNVSYPNLLL